MIKKKIVISYLVCSLLTQVFSIRRVSVPPTCNDRRDTGQIGSCVDQRQCPAALRLKTGDCRSPTGRRLICCRNTFPVKESTYDGRCGVRPNATLVKKLDEREMQSEAIVGGVESWRNGWPWMTAIFERRNFLCGGTLITPNCVLTAAHCFDGKQHEAQRFWVRLGEHNLYNDVGDEYPEEIQAKTVHVHPRFEVNCSDHDIAVIRLKKPSIQTPICLPDLANKQNKFVDRNAVVSGWGTTKYDSQYREPFSPFLQEISIPVKKTSFCEEHYKSVPEFSKAFKHGLQESRFICAGVEDGTRDACLGDSGGPLILEMKEHQWFIVGVVCIGYGCGMKGYPGVYTRVTEYMDWFMQFCEN